MFQGTSIVLDGDERVALEQTPGGPRVVIRDGRSSLSFEVRHAGTAHALAVAFTEAQEGMAAREEERLRSWIAA